MLSINCFFHHENICDIRFWKWGAQKNKILIQITFSEYDTKLHPVERFLDSSVEFKATLHCYHLLPLRFTLTQSGNIC